jgi:hypothetical protein
MNESETRKIVLQDFLQKLRCQEIVVTTDIGVWTGQVVEFDNHHLVITGSDGMSLLKIEEIIAIDWSPRLEISIP